MEANVEAKMVSQAPGRKETILQDNSISVKGLAQFTDSLPRVVQEIGSLGELEKWLRSQRGVQSISTSDYLVKTEPPLRELTVSFKLDDGSTVTRVMDIRIRRDGHLELAEVHEP